MDLFSIGEFTSYLRPEPVDSAQATIARRIANGWLLNATGLIDWPVVSDALFGWGLELAAIAYHNPDATINESIDDHAVTYDRNRRREILEAAAAAYGNTMQPQYSFPDPDWHWTVVPTVSPLT